MADYRSTTPQGSGALDLIAGRPGDVLVALDFDGTLAPIVPDPDQARPDPAALAAFGRLGGLVGQVVIVTGRPVRTCVRLGGFDRVAGLGNLIVSGQYGVERWEAATNRFDIPPAPAAIRAAGAELPPVLAAAGHPDAMVEDKGRALAVHTRRLADPQGALDALVGPVTELARRHGLTTEPGRFVVEIRASASDKGDAIRALVAETGARVVVYGGDDLGDVAAFEAVRELGERGLAGVRLFAASSEQPALAELADVICDGTAGIAAWLDAAADAIEARRGSPA